MVLTTNVDSIDDAIGEDACDNWLEVKVVVETVGDDTVVVGASDGDPHITLKFPLTPPEIHSNNRTLIYIYDISVRVYFFKRPICYFAHLTKK